MRITLIKRQRDAASTWKSLLEDQFAVDAITLDEMQKKATLERFQMEHPGFDFSGADISGNYQSGGPVMPS